MTSELPWWHSQQRQFPTPGSFALTSGFRNQHPSLTGLQLILDFQLLAVFTSSLAFYLLSTRSLPTTLRLALTCSCCNLKFQLHRGLYLNAPINFTTVLASSAANSATTARCSLLRNSSFSHVSTYYRRSTGRLTLAFT